VLRGAYGVSGLPRGVRVGEAASSFSAASLHCRSAPSLVDPTYVYGFLTYTRTG
jgi:hypothetical protein